MSPSNASSNSLSEFKKQYATLADWHADRRQLDADTRTKLKDLSVLDHTEGLSREYFAPCWEPFTVHVDERLPSGSVQTEKTSFDVSTGTWGALRLLAPPYPPPT